MVETSTAQKSFVISSKEVTEIPLNGRDFQSLMRTLPGVVSNDTSDFRLAFNNTNSFNVNGQRGSSNNVFLDGAINTDVGANDGQYTQISLDAVGEFKLQTSAFNAEYGRNPGVMISINTKSGGSSFHGTAYEFLRNDAFDARRPFDTTGIGRQAAFRPIRRQPERADSDSAFLHGRSQEAVLLLQLRRHARHPAAQQQHFHRYSQPADSERRFPPALPVQRERNPADDRRQQRSSGRDGVPARHHRPRFFGPRYRRHPLSEQHRSDVAMESERAGVHQAAELNPACRGDAHSRQPGTGARSRSHRRYMFNKNAKVARVDYNISPNMNFFFRWADDAQQEQQDIGIFASLPYPVYPQFREKPGASWSWNLVNVISPRTTNEFIFAYNHLTQVVDVVPGTDKNKYDRTALGFKFQELFPDQNVRNRFPSFNCGIGSCNFSPFQANWRSEGKTYAFTDNLTHVRGTHNFKTGIYFNWNDNGQQPGWSDALNINFGPNASNPNDTGNQFANMLLGNYTSVSQTKGIFYGAFRFFVTEAYVQDSWKVNRKLTLEYGVRWGYEGPTYTRGKYLQYYFEPNLYDPSKAVEINTASGVTNGTIIPGSGNPYNGLVQEGSPGLAARRRPAPAQ